MKYLKQLDKVFILLIIFSVIVYTVNIVDISFFASNFEALANNIQGVAGFIPEQTIQNIQVVLEIIGNATTAYKLFVIGISIFSALATVLGLLVLKYFVKRVVNSQTLFNYLGLIVISAYLGFSQFKDLGNSFSNLNSLPQFLIFALTLTIMLVSGFTLIVGVKKFIDYLRKNWKTFNYRDISYELIKTFSFIAIFYVSVIIIGKFAIYVTVAGCINQIDLAALIDIMNLVNVDLESIIPPEIFESGLITSGQLDMIINNVFDQYILDYASTIIQNIGLNIARTIIFADIVKYVFVFGGSVSLIILTVREIKYSNYIIIAIASLLALLCLVFLSGLVLSICAIAFLIIVLLMCLDVFKEYKM